MVRLTRRHPRRPGLGCCRKRHSGAVPVRTGSIHDRAGRLDIEAVPDFEAARRLLAQCDSMSDAEIRRMLGERYSRDGEEIQSVLHANLEGHADQVVS
jgi:hypothetical protein